MSITSNPAILREKLIIHYPKRGVMHACEVVTGLQLNLMRETPSHWIFSRVRGCKGGAACKTFEIFYRKWNDVEVRITVDVDASIDSVTPELARKYLSAELHKPLMKLKEFTYL